VGGESEDETDNAPYRIPLYAMLNLVDTLILGIELPNAVVTSINRKIEQYYISEEYKFRVAREIRESERKKIEAEGIHEFQQIVSQGISDSYLQWSFWATRMLPPGHNRAMRSRLPRKERRVRPPQPQRRKYQLILY
jgi:hypothetical protein